MSISVQDLENFLKASNLTTSLFEKFTVSNSIAGEQASVSVNYNKPSSSSSSSSTRVRHKSKKTLESYSQDYIDFSYENPTTYHVVDFFSKKLLTHGFTYLSEKTDWHTVKPGKYFTTRSGLNLAAFVITDGWEPSCGVGAVGSHIDSLALKLKPNSTKPKKEGYELLGVAPYSGALSDKWWDRDLAIGGRVLIKHQKNGVVSQLVNSTPQPIARISSLAEHFGAAADGPFNKETQMVPIIGFSDGESNAEEATEDEKKSNLYGKHPIKLLRYIAKLAKVEVSELYQFDLDLFDNQRGTIGGLEDDFLSVPRIDDKLCSFAAIDAIIEATHGAASFNIVALYDNEEIGSLSRQGAQGKLLESVVEKVITQFGSPVAIRQVWANSLLLSADVTHAYNPNFESQYLKYHRPSLNTGIVCKYYNETNTATDRVGYALIKQIAELNNDVVQLFSARNDVRTGSTIGSMISSSTGARTIDVGIPELAMHSIRGLTGIKDIGLGVKFFKGFFKNWNDVYRTFERDV